MSTATDTVEQLKELGYKFNDEGVLVKVDAPEEGFTFQNQAHYEKLGDVVANEIQRRMRDDYHLDEHWLSTENADDDSKKPKGCKCNVFTTPDILTSEAPLAVFICGTGAVVAGQWARSLCINNTLDEGSSLPDIEMALKNKWSVLVMNNNMPMGDGSKLDNSNGRALYTWERFVRPSRAHTIAILAHSYGGINTCYIINKELKRKKKEKKEEEGDNTVLDKIACIAFTDSVHYPPEGELKEWFMTKLGPEGVRNWVQSDNPLDTPEKSYDCIECVSAGHRKHEFTTCRARTSVHKFMIENVNKAEEKRKPLEVVEEKKEEKEEEKKEEKKEEEEKEEEEKEKEDEKKNEEEEEKKEEEEEREEEKKEEEKKEKMKDGEEEEKKEREDDVKEKDEKNEKEKKLEEKKEEKKGEEKEDEDEKLKGDKEKETNETKEEDEHVINMEVEQEKETNKTNEDKVVTNMEVEQEQGINETKEE